MNVDDIVETYGEISQYPNVAEARICNEELPGHIRVLSHWSQRDLERKERIKFSRTHIVQFKMFFATPLQETNNEIWNVESPSGNLRAIIRELKDKKGEQQQYIEVWDKTKKIQSITVSSFEQQHGKIYDNDGHFGCLEWSKSESHLLYVAEKKQAQLKSYFDRKAAADIESGKTDIVRGEEFLYKDNWGEQLYKRCQPVLCVLDVDAAVTSTLDNLPDNVSPGQAVWCPNDEGVVCVGWYNDPYRLGLKYCPIRRSALFFIDLNKSECSILGSNTASVRSPVFSPDFSKFVFLENKVGGPHCQCSSLKMCDWATKGIVEVVDIVKQPEKDAFPGLFLLNLNKRCWARDSRRVIADTQWRSKQELVFIDTETGSLKSITKSDPQYGSWDLMDVKNDVIVVTCSSPSTPDLLMMADLPALGSETSIKWSKMDSCQIPSIHYSISWISFAVEVPKDRINQKYPDLDYECVLMKPKGGQNNLPLVVYNHGGPHSVFSTGFLLFPSALVKCGFAVLLVNYRGSIGFGQDSIDSLPGNIGRQDVQDIQSVVEIVVEKEEFDRNRVVVIGGSHGGFLTTHLIGQYPNFYKAAVARNPVTNLAYMSSCTDIPDWCYTEVGDEFEFGKVPDAASYQKLYEMSPISHVDKMKTPLMLMVGEEDLRVPDKQAHELHKALIARGKKCRLFSYPGNNHPISKVDAEADCFINIAHWFFEHISSSQ